MRLLESGKCYSKSTMRKLTIVLIGCVEACDEKRFSNTVRFTCFSIYNSVSFVSGISVFYRDTVVVICGISKCLEAIHSILIIKAKCT